MAVALVVLMLVPPVATGSPAAAPELDEGDPLSTDGSLPHLHDWLVGGRPGLDVPTEASRLLGLGEDLAGGSSWSTFYEAYGLAPTASEAEALRRFDIAHPAVSAEVRRLAAAVGEAETTRAHVFEAWSVEERSQVHAASVLLARGEPELLTASQWALLAELDLDTLRAAASGVAQAADTASQRLPTMLQADAQLSAALPADAREAALAGDVVGLLEALGEGAAPVHANISLAEALRGFAALSGVRLPAAPLPIVAPGIEEPLAAILLEKARADIDGRGDERALLATIARVLPALERAAFNLSMGAAHAHRPQDAFLSVGQLMIPAYAPLKTVELGTGLANRTDQVAAAPSLDAAIRALHVAVGRAAPGVETEPLEGSLGAGLSLALASILQAQAAYERDLAPAAPLPSRVAAAMEAARPLLDRAEPLQASDRAVLQEALAANAALRALAAERAKDLALATMGAQEAGLAEMELAGPLPSGVLYQDDLILVTGSGDEAVSRHRAPLLLLDLGGDDRYTFPVASAWQAGDNTQTSIAIELGGNDTYETNVTGGVAAARGAPGSPAFSLLLEASGNDAYRVTGSSLAWAVDGFAVLVDEDGDDAYRANVSGLAGASSTDLHSIVAASFLDFDGDDTYFTPRGFGHLFLQEPDNPTSFATAVFLDVYGRDAYIGECDADIEVPCFATPRVHKGKTYLETGLQAFIDAFGEDRYPGGRLIGSPAAASVDEGRRVWIEMDGSALLGIVGTTIDDRDGDKVPDVIEAFTITDPSEPDGVVENPGMDTDGDAWLDDAETLVGTDPADPASHPVGVPALPAGADPAGTIGLPESFYGQSEGFLLDAPRLGIGIGLPGRTEYVREYGNLSLDLGIASDETSRDFYLHATARGGVAIDLGGDDAYTPPTNLDSGLAAATSRTRGVGLAIVTYASTAVLIDIAGDDLYQSGDMSQAASSGGGFALLLDASGDDKYVTKSPVAQGYVRGMGSALFFDLDGTDSYRGAAQAIVAEPIAAAGGTGARAVLFDANGDDTYDLSYGAARPETIDAYQGAVNGRGPDTVHDRVSLLAENSSTATRWATGATAAFIDAGGIDKHLVRSETSSQVTPVDNNDRIRTHGMTEWDPGILGVFVDATASTGAPRDSDSDGSADTAEAVAGTPAHDADVEDGTEFLLRLPRLGIAVGAGVATTFVLDYAVAVDIGGDDVYSGRAGASTPVWGTAALIDSGAGSDVHVTTAATPLSQFSFFRAALPGSFAEDALVGSAQGAGVFGIGVLYDDGGANTFDARVHDDARADDPPRNASAAVVAQGAGFLGVGLLVLSKGNATFHAQAQADGLRRDEPIPRARASGFSQGAGIVGIGILAIEAASGRDDYTLQAEARGDGAKSRGGGQGYALSGVGILLDAGGSNQFTADSFAQGAADQGSPALSWSSAMAPSRMANHTLGALLLPGEGDDALFAESQSQGFAERGGSALLFDARGNDVRELRPEPGSSSLGQAAASEGLALLLDGHGSDTYSSKATGAPDRAQAYAERGRALLVDLSGHDLYVAGTYAQAMVWRTSGDARLTPLALLLDRMGEDQYILDDARAVGQANVTAATAGLDGPTVGPVNVSAATAGLPAAGAFFVDASGFDSYGSFPGVPVLPTQQTPPGDRNNWVWGNAAHVALGIDDESFSNAYRLLQGHLQIAGGAYVDARLQNGAEVGAEVNGSVNLRAGMRTALGPLAQTRQMIERSEFQIDRRPLSPGNPSGDGYAATWDTTRIDAVRNLLFPDGVHLVSALLYPNATLSAPVDGSSRSAGTDVEPFSANLSLAVDNPPITRGPITPSGMSLRGRNLVLPVFVDRDLELGNGNCSICAADPIPPREDEWNVTFLHDPFETDPVVLCAYSTCRADVSIWKDGAGARFTWSAPSLPNGTVVGYRLMQLKDDTATPVGFVDGRWGTDIRLSLPNATIGDKYRVDTLTIDALRLRRANGSAVAVPAVEPGIAYGLNARGAEGGISLAWASTRPDVDYEVERLQGGVVRTWATTNTSVVDVVGIDGLTAASPATYRVRVNDDGDLGPWSQPAIASAIAGHNVTLAIEHDAGVARVVLSNVELGGAQWHLVDGGGSLPDGDYRIRTKFVDQRGKASGDDLSALRIDSTAPRTEIRLPETVSTDFVGTGGLRVPFHVHETGTGVADVRILAKVDDGPWRLLQPTTLQSSPDGMTGYVLVTSVFHGSRVQLAGIAEDAVGNVEAHPVVPWIPTIEEAVPYVQRAGVSEHLLDLFVPIVAAPRVDAAVAPGARIVLSANVTELGSGLSTVVARIGAHVAIPMELVGESWTAEWVAAGVGEHDVIIEAADGAGNVGSAKAGSIIVDDTPPVLVSGAVTFGAGRTLGRPGDQATLRIVAADAPSPRLGTLTVRADLANVSSRGVINLTWERASSTYQATFVIDRLPNVGAANVTVILIDAAGNQASSQVPTQVDGRQIGLENLTVVVRSPTAVQVSWNTSAATAGRLEYGLSPQTDWATPPGPPRTTHSIAIDGLRPGTRHYARVVSTSAAGVDTVSELFDFTLPPGIGVELGGVPQGPAATVAPIHARIEDHHGRAVAGTLDVYLQAPRGLARLVQRTEVDSQGTNVDLDIGALRDGVYTLIFQAKAGGEASEPVNATIRLDRTAPLVRVAVGSVVREPIVTATVEDRGSGIDMARTLWTFGGSPCAMTLKDKVLSCSVPQLNNLTVEMKLVVVDLAGNEAQFGGPVRVNIGSAPLWNVSLTQEGASALRPGAPVSVEAEADSVVTSVRVSAEWGAATTSTALGRIAAGRFAGTLEAPAEAKGPVVFRFNVTLASGASSTTFVTRIVDAEAPRVTKAVVHPRDPESVGIEIDTDESTTIELIGRATSISPLNTSHYLIVRDLPPGLPFEGVVRVRDAAGNFLDVPVHGVPRPDYQPPGAPSSIRARDLGDGFVEILWGEAEDDVGVARYELTRTIGEQVEIVAVGAVGRASDTIPLETNVSYALRAVDYGGNPGPVVRLDVSSDALPRLSVGAVEPAIGAPGVYTFTVTASAARGTPAVTLVLNGEEHAMTTRGTSCVDGCRYDVGVPLTAERLAGGTGNSYYFVAQMGAFSVRFPPLNALAGPTVIDDAAASGPVGLGNEALHGASRVPLPTLLPMFAAIALVVTALVRRPRAGGPSR